MAENQTVGNIGLYYVCYRLSQHGWNVMPTSRNARGVDIVAYSQDGSRKLTFQVKSLSMRTNVGLGKERSHLIADLFIVCRYVQAEIPECFVLTTDEVKKFAVSHGTGKKAAFWMHAGSYEAPAYRENWKGIGTGR